MTKRDTLSQSLISLSKKTKNQNHLQILEQRQHIQILLDDLGP